MARLLLSALGLVVVLLGAAAPAGGRTVTLRADPWCPFNCHPEDPEPGFLIELARAVLAPHGYRVDYALSGWKRTLEAVRRGEISGAVGAGVEDAPDFLFPSEPMARARWVLAVRRGESFAWTGVADLEGRVVGAVVGYGNGTAVDDYLARHARDPRRVQLVSGLDAAARNLEKLLARRIDLVYDDRAVLTFAARRRGLEDRIEFVSLGATQVVGIGFSPARAESRELVRILDEGIRRLRASGELARLEARYGLDEPPPPTVRP